MTSKVVFIAFPDTMWSSAGAFKVELQLLLQFKRTNTKQVFGLVRPGGLFDFGQNGIFGLILSVSFLTFLNNLKNMTI